MERKSEWVCLEMSGVANPNRAAVEEALLAYATERGGNLETVGKSTDPSDALLIAELCNHVTVMYPDELSNGMRHPSTSPRPSTPPWCPCISTIKICGLLSCSSRTNRSISSIRSQIME